MRKRLRRRLPRRHDALRRRPERRGHVRRRLRRADRRAGWWPRASSRTRASGGSSASRPGAPAAATPTSPASTPGSATPALRAFATDPDPTWSPVSVTAPTMPASATVGDVVTCTPGTWTGEDLTVHLRVPSPRRRGRRVVQSGPSNTYTVTAGRHRRARRASSSPRNDGRHRVGAVVRDAVSAPVTPAPVVPDGVARPAGARRRHAARPRPGGRHRSGRRHDRRRSPRASRRRARCAAGAARSRARDRPGAVVRHPPRHRHACAGSRPAARTAAARRARRPGA